MAEEAPYALSVRYNDAGPFTAVSSQEGGLSLELYNSFEAESGYMCLHVSVKTAADTPPEEYWLETIKPGDHLTISYQRAVEVPFAAMKGIESHARRNETYEVPSGRRLGLDTYDANGRNVRLSHPPNGEFGVVIANVPLSHARVFVTADNEGESWRWQLVDLWAGNSLELDVVETDWNTPFPRIKRVDSEEPDQS